MPGKEEIFNKYLLNELIYNTSGRNVDDLFSFTISFSIIMISEEGKGCMCG